MCLSNCGCGAIKTTRGPIGPTGATGATGPAGPPGADGAAGAQGPPGANGSASLLLMDVGNYALDGQDISVPYTVTMTAIPAAANGFYTLLGHFYVGATGSQNVTYTVKKNGLALTFGSVTNFIQPVSADTGVVSFGLGILGVAVGDVISVDVSSDGTSPKLKNSCLNLFKR